MREEWQLADAERIRAVMSKRGHELSADECFRLWEEFSERMNATWMVVPESEDEIAQVIIERLGR